MVELKINPQSQAYFLQSLAYGYGDFFVATHYKDGRWSKWRSVLEIWESGNHYWLELANNRSPFDCELIIDLDYKITPENLKELVLKLQEMDFYQIRTYFSGSKSYHIHIIDPIFSDPDQSQKIKRIVLEWVGADLNFITNKHMIALENCPHWKTGRMKQTVNLFGQY